MGALDRIGTTPALTCGAIVALTLSGFALDRMVDVPVQHLLGLCCWVFLIGLLRYATPLERVQTLVVVVVATFFEVLGSVMWGVYVYRHGNLPMFVPPGHGMVYLFGLRLTQTRFMRAHHRTMVRAALVAGAAWALAGLTVLDRTDVGGAFGVAVLSFFLLRGRVPHVYAGVFFFVAFLELYGVAMGTWAWKPEIPYTGIPNGNPPSGIASGYVYFDMAAIALAPFVLEAFRWARRPVVSALGRNRRDPGGRP